MTKKNNTIYSGHSVYDAAPSNVYALCSDKLVTNSSSAFITDVSFVLFSLLPVFVSPDISEYGKCQNMKLNIEKHSCSVWLNFVWSFACSPK